MILAESSLRPRTDAPTGVARPALASRLQGAPRRTAHLRAVRALLAAGLLGCGLHLPAHAAPSKPVAHASVTHVSAPARVAFASMPLRSQHVLSQRFRKPVAKVKAAAFKPRFSMPDLAAPRLELASAELAFANFTPIETPHIITQVSADKLRLSNRYFAHKDAAPRANLMPRAVASLAPDFPNMRFPAFADSSFAGVEPLPDLVETSSIAPASVPLPKARSNKRVPVVSNKGGGKFIQFMSSAVIGTEGTAKNNVSAFAIPAPSGSGETAALPPSMPGSGEVASGMRKVIKVPGLALPPLSQPLPDWMKAASVRVDRLEKPKNKTADGKRLAQNPNGAPVRQPANPVTNSDRLSNQIEVATSTFVVLLTTTDLQTVAVADPSIADVAVVNSRSVLLNGKAPGVTSLVIVDGQKIRQYSVRVTNAPGSRPVDVAAAIGIPGVSVRPVKDSLVLEGEVASADEAKRAEEIAGVYATKVINQLTVRSTGQTSTDASMAQLSELLADYPGVKARMAGDTVILSGEVSDPVQIQNAETIAAATGKKVVNLIQLPSLSVDQLRQSLGGVNTPQTLAQPGQLTVGSPISVRELGGQLIIEGFADSQGDIDVAVASAKRTGLPVVNRLQVRPALTADQAFVTQVAAAIGRPNVRVRGTALRLVLEGQVDDTNEAVLAEQVARGYVTPNIGQVDNLLQTKAPVQVNVDVTIAELNSDDARQLGVQYGTATVTSETDARVPVLDGNGSPVVGTDGVPLTQRNVTRTIDPTLNQGIATLGNGFLGQGGFGFLDPFRARIQALVNQNRGKILSAPSTTVLSGRTATFQVGGQVPIPALQTVGANGNQTAIEFKDYGILLDVVPNALPSGVVTLRIRTEVSQPDFTNGITLAGGSIVPGFQRRSTVTEVTVPPSGIVSLSGLIRSEDTKTKSGIPVLSKIPIIGSLFQSKSFRQNKTELVVFVKPRVLPNPLTGDQTAPAGVVAVGDNNNVATQLGNPGIASFNGGSNIGITAGAVGGAR